MRVFVPTLAAVATASRPRRRSARRSIAWVVPRSTRCSIMASTRRPRRLREGRLQRGHGDRLGWVAALAAANVRNKRRRHRRARHRRSAGNGSCEARRVRNWRRCPLSARVLCTADCGATVVGTGDGCGNSRRSTTATATSIPPNPESYLGLASLLADDELFLNTSKPACQLYLALEYDASQPNGAGMETTCGGRKLDYDVVDFSLVDDRGGPRGLRRRGRLRPEDRRRCRASTPTTSPTSRTSATRTDEVLGSSRSRCSQRVAVATQRSQRRRPS